MLPEVLRVETVALTILGHPMSWIELVGTLCYLASVWLIARRHMWTWPIGIVSVLLFMVLFWQIRLYADAAEQIYYLVASAYGWWHWRRMRREQASEATPVVVGWSTLPAGLAWLSVTAGASVAVGAGMTHVHVWWPTVFPEPASFPWLDAATTMMSFTAMWLLARRRLESWLYWIVVDVLGIGLYWVKEVRFLAFLYVVLLGMATYGLVSWLRERRTNGA